MNLSGISRSTSFGRLLRWPLRFIPSNAVMPVLQGPLRGAKWVAGSLNHGCWLGSYEAEKQRLFADAVCAGAVVYDIGANVGFYTLLAAKLVGEHGRVISFEPLPRNLELLRRHVSLNRFENVQIVDAAVSRESGEASFDDSPGASMGALSDAGRLRVRLVSIDELLERGDTPAPDLIKIDVEGGEDAVLEGATEMLSSRRPTIFFATHGDEVKARCLTQLDAIGYSVSAIGAPDMIGADEFVAVARVVS